MPQHDRMERVVKSLGSAPGPEAERVLGELARRSPQLVSQHEWVDAFLGRGTVSAARMLIDLVCNGTLVAGRVPGETWSNARLLATFIHVHPELRSEVVQRYEALSSPAAQQLMELLLSEISDAECVAALVRGYARNHKAFDGLIHHAIREAALDKRPAPDWAGAFNLHPAPLAALRRELFGMLEVGPHEAALAAACLTAIDELRDEYGPAESEPRHPNVETGRPWPLAAGGADS
jgi:hypothetical protein